MCYQVEPSVKFTFFGASGPSHRVHPYAIDAQHHNPLLNMTKTSSKRKAAIRATTKDSNTLNK